MHPMDRAIGALVRILPAVVRSERPNERKQITLAIRCRSSTITGELFLSQTPERSEQIIVR
jgi:hypothetical protein